MGIERAAEILANMTDQGAKADLFCHFVDYFNLTEDSLITTTGFAVMCGYAIAYNIRIVE